MIVFDIVKISLTALEIAINVFIKQWLGIFIISIYITSHWFFWMQEQKFSKQFDD